MTRLRKILPQTIRGQITSLIISTVVVCIVFVTNVIQFLQPKPSPLVLHAAAITQMTTLAQLAKAGSASEVDTLVALARRAGLPVDRASRAELETRATPADRARLAARLYSFDNVPEHAILESAVPLDGNADRLLIRLRPNDGIVVQLSSKRVLLDGITVRAVAGLVLIAFTSIVLSVYAARWITSPLSYFADVADSFGRQPDDDRALSENGPREIAQVARALNDMRARIRSIVESRTLMLAAIGHDLRTPLTRLRLYLEVAPTAATQVNMAREIRTIDNMLSETLAYLRDESRIEITSPVDLSSLLQTICSDFSDIGHRVSYRGPNRIRYDGRLNALTRAITNLVENGVRHGSEVSVSLRSDGHEELTIEIADDGPGIPPALKARVFEPFFKVDNARASSERTGFGLGLSIVRDVIRSHHGQIELRDRVPHGLSVLITLPVLTPGDPVFSAQTPRICRVEVDTL